MADRKNANRLSGNWNGSVAAKEPSLPHTKRPASSKSKSGGTIHKNPPETLSKQPSSPRSSQKADVKVKPPLAPKPQLLPKPQNIPPRSPQHGRSYAHCNGEASGRLSSELLEMEPETMEFKSVTSGGLPLSSPLVTAVRRSQKTQPIPSNPTKPKGKTQENGVTLDNQPILDNQQMQGNKSCLVSKDSVHVPDDNGTSKDEEKTNGLVPSRDAQGHVKGADHPAKKKQPTLLPMSFSNLKQPPPVSPKPTSPIDRFPLSLPASTPVSPSDPMKVFNDGITPPNGVHPWSSRNGSVQSGPRRVSLSHESLSPKNTDAPLSLTTSLTLSSSKGMLEGREPGRSGSGSDLRTSSSSLGGRLPVSALRGRIQALPWYMTRSQEILGTLDYPSTTSINGDTSGFGSGLSVASGASDLNKTPIKVETAPLKRTGKENDLEDGAEVVIATIKEADQVTSLMKRANETNGSHQNLNFKDNGLHSDSVSSEQPQSRPHSGVGLGGVPSIPIGGDSPSSSLAEGTPPQQSKEACGCRTVYANCFSGDTEEGVGFDEELTIYEFSRRTRPKPARPPVVPLPTSTAPSPSPTILSLLKDNPRPLSTFSTASVELSPLISHQGASPTLGFNGPLRSISNKRYGGLKGGFASLRQDIDHLLLVLERGTVDWAQQIPTMDSAQNQTGKHADSEGNDVPSPVPNCPGQDAAFMTEAERSLLQAEARRLATGCQRATRVGWAPDEALRSLSNSFSALVQLSAACLRTHPCPGCEVCRQGGFAGDLEDEREETMDKLKEIVDLYREFVGDVETAGTSVGVGARSGLTGSGLGQGDGEGVRLLAKRCTVLISSVFGLTQLFRTRTPDPSEVPGHAPLNF